MQLVNVWRCWENLFSLFLYFFTSALLAFLLPQAMPRWVLGRSDDDSEGQVCKKSLHTSSAHNSPSHSMRVNPEGKSRPASAHSSRPHSRSSTMLKIASQCNKDHRHGNKDKELRHIKELRCADRDHHHGDVEHLQDGREQHHGDKEACDKDREHRHGDKEHHRGRKEQVGVKKTKQQGESNFRARPPTPALPPQQDRRSLDLGSLVPSSRTQTTGQPLARLGLSTKQRRQRPLTLPVDVGHLYSSVDGNDSDVSHSYTCASEVSKLRNPTILQHPIKVHKLNDKMAIGLGLLLYA